MFLHVGLEGRSFFRDQERNGRKVEQFRESAPHSVVNHAEFFFAAKILEAWISVVIHFFLHHEFNVFVN